MAFVLQDVINEIEETRSLEPLKKLKKENLVKVAAHYGITPAIGATKSHILDLIKEHCVENNIIDEVEEKPIAETAEIVKLKLDFEREERRLAREAEKAAREEARELRLAELKEARELRELELKAEQEKALLEAEKEAAAREHELKMASLGKHSPSDKASVFDPARNIRLVPPFQEKEVDKYFAHFEKVADSLNWPKESWVLLLQSVLVGKAQEIYGSLSVEQSSNYEHVKEAILKAYELVPEAYRQKFRNYLKFDSKTHVEFAREKENLFNRWCHSKEIGQDFKKLKQMVLLEEFKDKVRPDIRSHLDEQKVEELEKAAIMADDYALTHKMSSKSGNPQQKRYHGSGNRENVSRNMDGKRQGKSTENVGLVSKVEPLKPISCGHCGKPGHIITNCWKLGGKTPCEHCGRFNHKSEDCRIAKNKLQKNVKPTGLTSLKGLKVSPFNESENQKGVKVKPLIDRNHFVEKNKGIKVNPLHNDKGSIEDKISPNKESDYMENYKPFISEGVVSLVGDENSSQKVKILRDTGATQSLMLDSVLPLTEKSFTGANVLISGVEMGVLEVPLHEVNIKSNLINGNIVIGMRPSLPVEGISLILGNDLAGEKVMVDPRVVEKPRDDVKTERLAEKFPGIFPASVVTRSMKAKKEAIKKQGKEEIGLSGTFLENIDVKFEERNMEKADKALMRNESRNVKENIPEKQESESKSVISRQNLIVEQSKDKELLDLFKITLTPVEAEKVSVGYLIRENILMRKWSSHCVTIRPPLLLLKEKWLDEDPEKISVLKYVATFKDRLFRAGQMAKRNLQESQSKMKVCYDRKAKSRCFEPGDRVLVLFPVVGNPLQAKYSGPYKVVKKISNTNYLVKTPGRHKETQVCHINMLKAYHEKPKPELVTLNNRLGLESPTHSKDCVGQVAEKEEDTESEVRLGNDQQPIKLQNSQILNDLGTKLSHLPSVQRKELAEVITQYREVFPDVPSKTNLIEHDVDVGDSAPIKQHPYRVSPMKKELLDKEVQYMLENDIIEESQSNWSSPCILVPKHDGGFRFCTDFRKVNDKTKSDSFPIPRIADCIDQIGNAKFVSTFDMLKGYWQVPLTQRAREISA